MDKCGCQKWVHGLESEMDRQLADCVAVPERMRECNGFGQNLGKCGRLIFVTPDGDLPRLCDTCERRWVQETQEGAREMSALLNLDTTKLDPN